MREKFAAFAKKMRQAANDLMDRGQTNVYDDQDFQDEPL